MKLNTIRQKDFAILCTLLLAFQVGCGEDFEESEPIEDSFSEEISGLVITEDFDEKIRGGKNAKTSPPDFVAIYKLPIAVNPHPVCGGTLVDKNTVLTAAHCFDGGGRFVACLGTRKVGECAATSGAVRADFHPSQDVALMHLAHDFKRAKTAKLASRSSDPRPRKSVTAYGFGAIKRLRNGVATPDSYDNTLRVLKAAAVSTRDCIKAWGRDTVGQDSLCTKASRKRGVCAGDSGGPLYYKGRQVGITSFVSRDPSTGDACTGERPDVFVRVSSVRQWITANLK